MGQPSIGLLVLARNEERSLGRCLDSVSGMCDEMIVLDMQSDDSTSAIARDRGARVVSVPPVDRYDSTRQVGLDLLNTAWVLQLDADEWATGVLEAVQEDGLLEHVAALAFPKANYLAGRWIRGNRWWPNHQIRMFRREYARYSGVWHGYLDVAGPVKKLPATPRYTIHHSGYESTAEMVSATARWAPPRQDLSASQLARILGRSLGGYVAGRSWRDGSDGVAILGVRLINSLAYETSRERRR